MMIIFIAAWFGVFWLLLSVGLFSRLDRWMKIVPAVIWVLLGLLVFMPMSWIAPTGPVVILARSIQISSSVAGIVTDVKPTDGQPLKKGDVLFTLDQTTYRSAVDQVKTQLELVKDGLRRKTQLFRRGAGREIDVVLAQSEVNRLTAALEGASWELEQTIIRAPSNGYVSNVVLPIGARVNANVPVMPFFNADERFIVVQIEQNHLRYIKVGQPAEVIFNDRPGQTFAAKVALISRANPAGQVTPTGLAISVETPRSSPFWIAVALEQTDLVLRPGVTGSAAIYTKQDGLRYVVRKVYLRMQSLLSYLFVF
jgi:RND family efflux transporter MFP subunit